MPGTPDQSSLAVIALVFDQSWVNGSVSGARTVSAIEKLPLRNSASVTAAANVFRPPPAETGTVAANEKVLSPAVTSPCVPSSNNACDDETPIAVRSAVTASPVLAGLVPGVTVAVSSVLPCPRITELGNAVPTADGLLDGSGVPVM